MDNFNLHCLYTDKTCFKTDRGTCIDLMLTNCKHSFKFSSAIETGLSDHHLMVYTMLKSRFEKIPPREFSYRCYKQFSEKDFIEELSLTLENLSQKPICYSKIS